MAIDSWPHILFYVCVFPLFWATSVFVWMFINIIIIIFFPESFGNTYFGGACFKVFPTANCDFLDFLDE